MSNESEVRRLTERVAKLEQENRRLWKAVERWLRAEADGLSNRVTAQSIVRDLSTPPKPEEGE